MLLRRVLDAEASVRLTPRMSETRSSGDPARIARALARRCTRAALATSLNGAPYASLVLLTVDLDASPLLLLSELAQHSRNIAFDPRVSLLMDGTGGLDDPLAGPRLTLLGQARQIEDPRCLARFVAHHPASAGYAGFRDFHLYRVAVERGHLVAGFGQIDWIAGTDFLLAREAAALVAVEGEIIRNTNARPVVMKAYAELVGGILTWRIIGLDPEGIDLRSDISDYKTERLDFAAPALSPEAARAEIDELASKAIEARLKSRFR